MITDELYQKLGNAYIDVHSIYEPDDKGRYLAAVDLFTPGTTFKVYFKLGDDGNIIVENIERWFFG